VKRLSYIDWMRGLACLLMFQTHCYDSWLRPELHQTRLYRWSQIGGTLPAPLFIFLAGVSVALTTQRFREKGMTRNAIARQTVLRGAEIFGLGILFRLQEYVLGYKWVPWTDLLRVDVLNMLGLSIILMGTMCWFAGAGDLNSTRNKSFVAALMTAAVIALATPPVWTSSRLHALPWPIESYINGVHTFHQPQPWLFPIFPWCAFAFVGLAVGFSLFSGFARCREASFFVGLGTAGLLTCFLALLFDALPIHLYSDYDFWHSNPDFFAIRCGVLLVILSLVYAWCRWGWAQKGFSPVIQLGTTSLLVYWVHIEFVYGRLSFLPKHGSSIVKATIGLLVIFLAMLGLSIWRTRYKKRTVKAVAAENRSVVAPVA
jgi:uncharacterized membrane protein